MALKDFLVRPITGVPPQRGPVDPVRGGPWIGDPIHTPVAPVRPIGGGNLWNAIGAAKAPPGMIASYDEGTNYVPQDGPYQLHEGEAVVPADQNPSAQQQDVAPNVPQQPNPSQDAAVQNIAQQGAQEAQNDLPRFKHTIGNTLKGILIGTLMDGVRGGIAGGISPTGAQRAVDQEQQMTQAKVKFANAQAANMVTEAAIRDQNLHNLPQEQQDAHNQISLQQMKDFAAMGIQPTLVVDNEAGGSAAVGGLQQLTDSHGAVPPLFTINLGHKLISYDLNQLTQAPQGLDQINKVRAVQGLPAIDSKVWAQVTASPQGRTQAVEQLNSALNFFNPAPSEQNLTVYQNYVNTLKAQPQSPERDANLAKLQGVVSTMKSTLDATTARANSQLAAKTTAEENAKVVAQNSPAAIAGAGAKAQAEQEGKNRADVKSFGDISDPFGVKVGVDGNGKPLDRKEYDAGQKTFSKEYVQPLNVLQKTNMEFDRINSNPNQTGAEKVTALLNAVGISGDPLKGKGFRISNDVINEHAQSRNIWESAVQKLNNIAGSGGPITSQQIADYTSVAQGVVHDAYVTAAQEARRQGLPVDFLPKATTKAQVASPLVAKIYLDAAQGDKQSAYKAMQSAGYK